MIGTLIEWVDATLSRYVVEPRFIGAQPSARLRWLDELQLRVQTLTEDDWFPATPELEPCRLELGRDRDAPTKTIAWATPALGAAERLGLSPHSQRPCARLYGDRGDAVWVLVHGWLGGDAWSDRWGLPFRRMLGRYDLLSYVLPGHGPRRAQSRRFVPSFPSRNPGRNAIGLASSVAELRQLVKWLRARGYGRVGIAGTSLGAHIAALYATVVPNCDRLLLERPLSRMSEPLRQIAQRGEAESLELLTRIEAIYAPVSPLERGLRMPPQRIDILLGTRDRIAGFESGQTLAAWFGVRAESFHGGHVLPLGRRKRLCDCLERL